jgi:hypothetical protein
MAHVDASVELDLTIPQTAAQRRASERARRASLARRERQRSVAAGRLRPKVDPTTCERDYSPAELEFLTAVEAYKVRSGRLFPTWSEVLEVLRDLGYAKGGGASLH